jgi:hypothetical protein
VILELRGEGFKEESSFSAVDRNGRPLTPDKRVNPYSEYEKVAALVCGEICVAVVRRTT